MSKRRKAARILMILSIVMIAVGTTVLIGMWRDYRAEEDLHKDLVKIHESAAEEGSDIDAGLLKLHKKNKDCIYWLRIPKTKIDYPVMYRPKDKDYYLHRDFNKKYSLAGTLYLSEKCDPVRGDNLIIYGHHMKTGTMFADLEKYKEESFYKKHKRIELETLHGHEDYEVIAAFSTPVYTGHDFAYYDFTETAYASEYDAYVTECKVRSYYNTRKTAIFGQRLLTLSTCEYSHHNGRMVVVAVQIQGGEVQ